MLGDFRYGYLLVGYGFTCSLTKMRRELEEQIMVRIPSPSMQASARVPQPFLNGP